ncbi:MAG: hypothetical protein ACLQPN_00070 [Bryobacteraceae bacterium]
MGLSRPVQCVGIIVAILCFAPLALAQDTFTLTGANPDYNSFAGVYVSPYTATITNGTSTVYSGEVICDDYFNDVSVGDSWTVQPETVGPGLTGEMFASPTNPAYPDAQADYDAVAWLAEQLIALPLTDAADQTYYSYAIWTIFDSAALTDYVNAGGTPSNVTNLITDAFSGALNPGVTVTIWTPTSLTKEGIPQEFITVQTPEASLPAALGVSLASLVGLIFLMRRRLVRPV